MNKTLTVNIGGIVFHIEEHAYETLRKYLESIKVHFTTADGGEEIMQDIESRIAEMLQEHISDSKQVIVEDDIKVVEAAMGKPEQFDDDIHEGKTGFTNKSNDSFGMPLNLGKRRLYRDTEDRVLGGVCSGIGHRIGIDPIWVRLIFFALIWGGGVSIWVYILLLIILPKAETNAQKLEMRGEEVNLSNLAKEAQSEPSISYGAKNTVTRLFDNIGQVIIAILKAFVYFFGAIFSIVGIVILITLFLLLLSVIGVSGLVFPSHLFDLFISPTQQIWSIIAIILVIGIPVFLIVYKIVKKIFKIEGEHPWFRSGALVFWIAGVILMFSMATIIASEFSKEASHKSTIVLSQPTTDTLFVSLANDPLLDEVKWDRPFGIGIGKKWQLGGRNDNMFVDNNVGLDIERASGTEFQLVKVVTARGSTEEGAYINASNLDYNVVQVDSSLILSKYYPLPKKSLVRGQEVRLVLKVPIGKSIYLSKETESILSDVDNVTNTWDWEMGEHTWTMTEKGLECIGCNLTNDGNDNFDTENVDVSVGDANIKIDSTGIRIATGTDTIISKNVSINVNGKGVQINTHDGINK